MQKKLICLWLFLGLFIVSQSIMAEEYFLYDLEEATIRHMGHEDTQFAQSIKIDKKPDLMMLSGNSEEYIAVHLPLQDKKKKTPDINGQLTVFNISNGRTMDIVDLGYYPFHWAYTKDHKHFFITYRVNPNQDAFELLHYDTIQKKTEKMPLSATDIVALRLSLNDSELYLLTQGNASNPSTFSLMKYAPLAIQKTFPAGANPQGIYRLSDQRVAILEYDPKKVVNGSLQVIDTDSAKVIAREDLNPYDTYSKWYEDARVLIVDSERAILFSGGYKGHAYYYKVSAEGIKKSQKTVPCYDFQYYSKNDQLYLLTNNHLEVLNFDDPKNQKFATGKNLYTPFLEGGYYFYRQFFVPDTDLQLIYCAKNGNVRIFNMRENKLIKEVTCGRPEKRSTLFKFTGAIYANTTITTNPDKSKYYILNRVSKDITVLDQDFNVDSYLPFDEQPLEMYQINKPSVQTLVTTVHGIYQIDHESLAIVPVYKFEDEVDLTYISAEDKRLFVWSNQEVVVIDPTNMEVKNSFKLFAKEDNMKVKKGNKRYFFIRAL